MHKKREYIYIKRVLHLCIKSVANTFKQWNVTNALIEYINKLAIIFFFSFVPSYVHFVRNIHCKLAHTNTHYRMCVKRFLSWNISFFFFKMSKVQLELNMLRIQINIFPSILDLTLKLCMRMHWKKRHYFLSTQKRTWNEDRDKRQYPLARKQITFDRKQ